MTNENEKPTTLKAALKDLIGPSIFCSASLWLVWALWPASEPTQPAPKETLSQRQNSVARATCMGLIKKSLNDPGSAQWGAFSNNFYGSWPAIHQDGNIVRVLAEFRSKNGFGALVFSKITCALKFDGEEVVGVVDLRQLN